MNKVILTGRLTKDVKFTSTSNGIDVAQFTLAVNRIKSEDADFINIVAWRKLAELCNTYLHKGSKIALTGSIQTRTYENQNKEKQYVTEVVAEDVEFLDNKEKPNTQPNPTDTDPAKLFTPVDDDTLPF